ncbi:hypothetical protein NDU88_005875 [Pleurodeles waltl]|uniref:Uncharacterized protein n=1 Tax=Pleurodeles waltl TaxID=8319 RepID=A0AAV7WD33_PLEWA|nr:hypothetical protein NDU88_005875 [Pleurodeles waltl]
MPVCCFLWAHGSENRSPLNAAAADSETVGGGDRDPEAGAVTSATGRARSTQAKIHADSDKAGHLLDWLLHIADSPSSIVRICILPTEFALQQCQINVGS